MADLQHDQKVIDATAKMDTSKVFERSRLR